MEHETNKAVTIQGRNYLVESMTPETACMIHSWLVFVALKLSDEQMNSQSPEGQQQEVPKNPQLKADGTVTMLWLMAPSVLSEANYRSVQKYALAVCKYIDEPTGAPVSVRMADGRWADVNLKTDPVAVGDLVTAALQFNIAPFFVAGLTRTAGATQTR